MVLSQRSTLEKIQLFQGLFHGLKHVYGTYDIRTGTVRQIKAPVTDNVIYAHLKGQVPYGVYLLEKDRTRALAVDFDEDDAEKPRGYVIRAGFYGLSTYIERSKSKGFHVWAFFEERGVQARKARLLAKRILADMSLDGVEVFPKQDQLDSRVSYGNFINAPLFGRHVVNGRTVFSLPDQPTTPYPNQWAVLEKVKRLSEERLDAILEMHGIEKVSNSGKQSHKAIVADKIEGEPKDTFGLPICARRMLNMGVQSLQRVACFRLAVNLKKVGLPQDISVAALKSWAHKNRPINDKNIITDQEINEQVRYAYERRYRGLGCEEEAISHFCDPNCHIRTRANEFHPCNM